MRRRWTAVVAVACALLLAGCSEIPSSGTVQIGPTQDVKNQDVVLVPYPPAAGEAPADIVQGFITAATGQQNTYGVARDYLTPTLAKTWKPDARVLIHDQSWQVKVVSDSSVVVTVPTTAEVDSHGVYTAFAAPRNVPVAFSLAKMNGQWRIAKTPDGIILGTNYFGSLFTARPVSYFDPGWSQSVPDLRWFPARRITPTGIVQALLAGPAAPLAPPVTSSAFPRGTRVRSVHVRGGVATVDLDTGSDLPSLTVVSRMRTQLHSSLANLPGVQDVQVAIDGRVERAPLLTPAHGVGASALVLRKGVVGTLSGAEFQTEPVLGRQLAAAKPSGGTVSLAQKLGAVLTAGGVALVTPSGSHVVDGRSGLIEPALDDRGWTYSVPSDDPNGWRAYDSRGRSVPVAVTMQDVTSITAIEASQDGTRMLVLASANGRAVAFVAGIVRSTSGTPLALTSERYPVDVPVSTSAIDATWVDAAGSSVAVLTQDDSGESVSQQQLGGLPSSLGRLSTADTLVGADNPDDLRARLQNGSIAQFTGSSWSTEPTAAADVLFVQR